MEGVTRHLERSKLWSIFTKHAASILIVAFLLHLLHTRYNTQLRRFPGPFLASFTSLWQVWVASSGKAEEYYMEVHRKYGPVARIGPNEISFAAPAAGRSIFKTGQGFHKTEFYTVFLPNNIKDIFTEIGEDVHATKKRYTVPPYSLSSVQQHTAQIDALMVKFLQKLDDFAYQGVACDLGKWLHYLAFDTLGEFAFANHFGFVDAGTDMNNTIATISDSTYESGIIAQMPFVERWTRSIPIWNYLPSGKNKLFLLFNKSTEVLQRFQGKETGEREKCLLRSLLEAHQANPDKFNLNDVLAVSMGAIGAGSDSTASTMNSFCWHVLSNPHAPLSDIVQFHEALELPYFQACLKEVMRLQPAVGMNITRQVPAGGTEIDGVYVQEGTQVALNGWVLHRDKETFGSDADVFNLERWLKASEQELKMMERSLFQFGGGSHVCIGRHLALFEINKTLPQVFRQYNIRVVDPTHPPAHRTGFFYIQDGLRVYLEKR
ncbi:cytochrome P450 oxidoreductase [Exophiala viscosa]|uniref:Cytochrome P450 oxidoreductase n=1 Tax=Exophiala viscosa TaxID=2486360 RepID=A0AAN6DXB1_9EURO|nr:cytochrome P450 oxidoreductase [Exophiala viscosa]